jgi:acetolactate synthase-1/2/3 large subunit
MSVRQNQTKQTAAQLLIRSLEKQDVQFIFGIPGGKIMPTFDVLNDEGPRLILCRHEQNAAFMAGAIGRLTGRPGVCMVTSGPGTGNLATGAATATTEGDPMVAIGGSVGLPDALKQTHQTLDSVAMMKPVTKYSVSINSPESTGEVIANAFRSAMAPRAGAAFIAFPQDVQRAEADATAPSLMTLPPMGAAPPEFIAQAAALIRTAAMPVLLLGMGASEPAATIAVRRLLAKFPMPTVGTFQGAGAISRRLLPLFYGRIGLFRNQPGDKLLAKAAVVITVGYDPVEYGPDAWNVARQAKIIHIDDFPSDIDNFYLPEVELRGSVERTLDALTDSLEARPLVASKELESIHSEWKALQQPTLPAASPLVHPLTFVVTLRGLVDDDTIIASDIGSNYIWMGRHFFDYEPVSSSSAMASRHSASASPGPLPRACSIPRTKLSPPSETPASSILRWTSRPQSGRRRTSPSLSFATGPTIWWPFNSRISTAEPPAFASAKPTSSNTPKPWVRPACASPHPPNWRSSCAKRSPCPGWSSWTFPWTTARTSNSANMCSKAPGTKGGER